MLDKRFGTLDVRNSTDSNAYTLGRVGKHYAVIACLSGEQYGTTSARTVANHIIRTIQEKTTEGNYCIA